MGYVNEIINNLKESGFHIERNGVGEPGIKILLEETIPSIENEYSEDFVERKLFRKREDTKGRRGDAVLVSLETPDTAPFLMSSEIQGVEELMYLYFGVLSNFLYGEYNKIPLDTKVLVNYQKYKSGYDNSLPYHFDAEIFKGEWDKEYIKLEEGLIPRLVMVIVLENENDGGGLKIIDSNGEEKELNLGVGDVLIFDNTKCLHGVPESVPNKRTMIGLRSFEVEPLYFKKDGFAGETTIKIDTPYVKGEAIELSTEEAKELLKEEGWYYE